MKGHKAIEAYNGLVENLSALAVRIGVNAEGMNPSQMWHATAEAIDQNKARQQKLVEVLKEIERLSWELGEQSPPAVRAIILSSLHEMEGK